MENEIVMYAAGIVGFRVAIVLAFAYGFYLVLRPQRAAQDSGTGRTAKARKADTIHDDRC